MYRKQLLHLLDEALGGLEARLVVSFNGDGRILLDVACCLGGTVLHDETAKATQVNILTLLQQAVLDSLHEALDNYGHVAFLQAGGFGDFVNDICLCHLSFFC